MNSRIAIVLVLAAVSCKKKPAAEVASGSAATPTAPTAAETPAAPPPSNGLAIKDVLVPEYSGSYDKVFARLDQDAQATIVAFVRGCPALTCAPGPWEPEQVAHTCPQAYIATISVGGLVPSRAHVDLKLAGPAEHASTATIEGVSVDLTDVGNDGVAGSVTVENTDATVNGSFKAEVCPRT